MLFRAWKKVPTRYKLFKKNMGWVSGGRGLGGTWERSAANGGTSSFEQATAWTLSVDL